MNKKLLLSLFFPQDTLEKWDIKTSKAKKEEAGQVLLLKGGVYWEDPVRAVPLPFQWKTTQELVSFPHMCVLPYIVRGMRAHNPNQPCGGNLSYDVTPPLAADDPE